MEKEKTSISELEKYQATLKELQVLREQLKQTLEQNESSLEMLKQQIDYNDKPIETLLASLEKATREHEKRTNLYRLILESASIFTLSTIVSVVANVFVEQSNAKSFPIVLVVVVIGVGVLISFGLKSWLDYSAQKETEIAKKLLHDIKQNLQTNPRLK